MQFPSLWPKRGSWPRLATLSLLALPASATPQDGDRLFEEREGQVPETVQKEQAHVDPSLDAWHTEVLQGVAKESVYALVKQVFQKGKVSGEALGGFLSEEFRGVSVLRPQGMEAVTLAGGTRAYRPRLDGEPDLSNEELEARFAQLLEPWGGASECEVAVKVVQCSELDEKRFTAEAWIQVHRIDDAGGLQQNFAWRMIFESVSEEQALLESIELRDFSEVHTRGAYFDEVTDFVLGDLPFYEREFMTGVDDYHYRVDRLTGNPFLGSQGLSLGDLNGDGLDDLYLPQQGGMPNRMLLREADGRLRDFSKESGTDFLDNTRSSLILDMDGDGDQDLVLAISSNILILYNAGDAKFEGHLILPNAVPSDIFSLSAADPDRDGDLDLYACRYIDNGIMGGNPTPYHDANNGSPNIYWRNEGEGQFTDATEEAGFGLNNSKFSLASIWEDFDGDQDLDLYVANDFGRNTLYRNDGERFSEVAVDAGAGETAASMGLSCSDIDLDGDMDVLVSNMFSAAGRRVVPQSERFMEGQHREVHDLFKRHARGNTLLINRGDGSFDDTTEEAGIELGRWAWGGRFTDFNGDGFEDMYVPNGFVTGPDPDDL